MSNKKNDSEWVANLLSELIRMGIDEDEHRYWKDRGFKNFEEDRFVNPPPIEELPNVDMGDVIRFLYPQLIIHLGNIIADYREDEVQNSVRK